MSQNLNKLFDDLLTRYVGAIEKNYIARYKKAKDKDFVKQELITDTEFVLGWSLLIPEHSQMIDLFAIWYKRGEEITDILDHIRTTYGEVEDERPFKRIENGKEITLYLSEEEKALKKLALDQRKLLKLLVRHTAYREIQSKLENLFDHKEQKTTKKELAGIKWTGTKDNKNEFVQLIYGLHQAGFINNGKGEVTKITEELANSFGIELGKNWQSNHSASIHKSKRDYEPPVFDKIKKAYLKYSSSLQDDKKKK